MEFAALLVVIVFVVWFASKVRQGYRGEGAEQRSTLHVCTVCHSRVVPKTVTPGSTVAEVFLWLMFLLPGLLYSIWRVSSRRAVCPVCGAPNPIPDNSPAAQRILQQS